MGVLFAALTTLCMLSLISAFYQADKVAVTLTLVNVGDVALFGLVIDRVSTLILFVVVFLGLLVTIYSTGYLTDKNREHPHNGTNRYYAFLLVFIGATFHLQRCSRCERPFAQQKTVALAAELLAQQQNAPQNREMLWAQASVCPECKQRATLLNDDTDVPLVAKEQL